MLISLSVKDVVLIDNLDLSFSSGFSALTGETGAGKSILMDALALVLGKRSENRLIRKGQDFASVTAEFNVGNDHKVIEYVRMSGLNAENEFILRRQIGAHERNRFYVS